jgi:Zn-dependent peptidase ImmA (M78 family)
MIAIFPEIMSATDSGDAEKLAILARKYFAGKDRFRPAPDLNALAESAGISIERVPLEVHGILAARDVKGTVTVAAFVNKNLGADEERFLLAHMLGHFFFEVIPMVARGEWNASGFRETFSPLKRFAQNISYDQNRSVELAKELLADRFAGALLMPVAMVIKASEKIKDQAKLAAFFGVSRPCLQRRLVDCGLIGAMPVSFMDAEQQLIAEHKIPEQSVAPMAEIRVDSKAAQDSLIKSAASVSYQAPVAKETPGKQPQKPHARATPSKPQSSLADMVANERRAKDLPASQQAAVNAGPNDGVKTIKGMERLREIARKLDKT